MSSFMQYVLSGLAIGGTYALVGLGFHIMWSTAKAVNFSHGDTPMLGAVATILLMDQGVPMAFAIPMAILVAGAFGMLLERVAVRPFAADSASIGWMLTTIAIGTMLEAYATTSFGGFSRPLPSPLIEKPITILGAGVYPQELLVPVVALLAMGGLWLLQHRTLFGRALRAVATNRTAATLMGINVNRIVALSFALAAALGDAAGVLVAPIIQASASMGLLLGLKGFAVAIMGGITSGPGIVAAALAFGVVEKFVEATISTSAREIVGFSLMILVLLVFPQGFFGKKEIFKV